MYSYRIETDFNDANADVVRSRRYFNTLSKYRAVGMGHEKDGSTMLVSLPNPLDIAALKKDLQDIKILSVSFNSAR